MAFYVPHPQQSAAKAKIDGFQPSGQQHQPPSPSNTFDPSSLFFSGPVFPDPFRNPHAGSGSMDFTETLLSMMPNNGGDGNQQHNQANGQQQIQQQQAQALQQQQQQQQQQNQQQQSQAGQPGAPLNLNIPQNIFDMSHFASPLSAFQQPPSQQQQGQQQRNTPKTETVDSPASLHTGHGFFDNSGTQPQQSHNPFAAPSSIPSYLNTSGAHRPESPTVANSIGSPTESGTAAGGGGGAGPTSPFPTHASHARMHGHRSPSIGPTSHSRSRSRGATSRPPASRNGMVKTGGPKRQSISSTPEEPATALPPPPAANARPQAILIPSHPSHPGQQQQQQQPPHHHAHHLSHEFAPHQLNSIGPHPISPLGIHSTQTAPGAWFVPSNGQAAGGQGAVEPGSFGIQHQDGIQQSFGQAFQPRSLSLGPNPKPGTSASASVLAGSLGTVPVGQGKSQQELAMDAAAKQNSHHVRAAILNEKRRRRRESHNAVERRRRDNINEKISELSTLLPESMLDPTGTNAGGAPTTAEGLLPTGSAALAEDGEKETPAMKANKGIILRKSVEYIRYLQQLVRVQATRNRELESQLAQYRGGSTSMDTSTPNGPNLDLAGPGRGDPFSSMLDQLTNIDEDGMPGIAYSPEDTTPFSSQRLAKLPEDSSVKDGSPRSGGGASEEEEERGRGVQRGRRGYNGNTSVSVGHGKGTLGVRDDSAELESAVSDGESRERMMD